MYIYNYVLSELENAHTYIHELQIAEMDTALTVTRTITTVTITITTVLLTITTLTTTTPTTTTLPPVLGITPPMTTTITTDDLTRKKRQNSYVNQLTSVLCIHLCKNITVHLLGL